MPVVCLTVLLNEAKHPLSACAHPHHPHLRLLSSIMSIKSLLKKKEKFILKLKTSLQALSFTEKKRKEKEKNLLEYYFKTYKNKVTIIEI